MARHQLARRNADARARNAQGLIAEVGTPMSHRPLSELLNTDDPAWPLVQQWITDAKNMVEILPAPPNAADELEASQVTLRSPMGAMVYHTGGLLIDHGWLRILGGG